MVTVVQIIVMVDVLLEYIHLQSYLLLLLLLLIAFQYICSQALPILLALCFMLI